jgi:hypothetical protein
LRTSTTNGSFGKASLLCDVEIRKFGTNARSAVPFSSRSEKSASARSACTVTSGFARHEFFPGAHGATQRCERGAEWTRDRTGARREHQTAACLHEQRIVELGTQPSEPLTRGGLRDAEPRRGACDVPFGEEDLQVREQVEPVH